MTIDEVIAHARENYNDIINTTYNKCQYEHLSCEGCATPTCKEIADENLQLAEWLEDLKSIKDGSIPIIHGKAELELHDKKIYNKALDEFIYNIKPRMEWDNQFYALAIEHCIKIAERLKEQKK